jgi:hypothetical protein
MKTIFSMTYHLAYTKAVGHSLLITYLKEYLDTIDKKEDNNDEQQHSITAVENMSIKTL